MHKWAAVKSSLGAQTVLGDRHDPVDDFFSKRRRPPAELARENFPTAGDANGFEPRTQPRIQPRKRTSF